MFAANCSGGRVLSAAPERWSGSWEDNFALARLCDELGIEFLVPVGRWKGYGGVPDHNGSAFETITWATALLGATKRVQVFGTVHCPLFHPLVAAKMMMTADHVGAGRFGLNIVAGWNEDEFKMFGADLRDHENRYAYAQEWIDVVRMAWERDDVDFDGAFFHLEGIRENPKPYGGTRPIVMNAGASPTGRAFALRNSDMFFTAVHLARISARCATTWRRETRSRRVGTRHRRLLFGLRRLPAHPRRGGSYVHYAIEEHANWGAMEKLFEGAAPDGTFRSRSRAGAREHAAGAARRGRHRQPDDVAAGSRRTRKPGLRGLVLAFVNFNAEVPYFAAEVLPRLERLGLRQPHSS